MRSTSAKGKALSLFSLLCLVFIACNNNAADDRPVIEFSNFDGGGVGCSQPSFPDDQPDISPLSPPIFLLTTTNAQESFVGQAQVTPGNPVEAEVTVNGATRRVLVELTNASAPDNVIFVDEFETAGGETLSLTMTNANSTRGRFYMQLTLCAADCDERAILFAVRACSDDPEDTTPCGINGTYERSIVERGIIVQQDITCVELDSEPGVGSGTVLIQP